MVTNLFDHLLKEKSARIKWDRLSEIDRQLVSMRFLAAVMSNNEPIKIEKKSDQVLYDGRKISIFLLEMKLGEFVFAIPHYVEGRIILLDFDIAEEVVILEAWVADAPH